MLATYRDRFGPFRERTTVELETVIYKYHENNEINPYLQVEITVDNYLKERIKIMACGPRRDIEKNDQ